MLPRWRSAECSNAADTVVKRELSDWAFGLMIQRRQIHLGKGGHVVGVEVMDDHRSLLHEVRQLASLFVMFDAPTERRKVRPKAQSCAGEKGPQRGRGGAGVVWGGGVGRGTS